MPRFIDTAGNPTLGIGICDRCHFKFPIEELFLDPNTQERVCVNDLDNLDPYRLPAREPDNLVLPFYRPDNPLVPTEEVAEVCAVPAAGSKTIAAPDLIQVPVFLGSPYRIITNDGGVYENLFNPIYGYKTNEDGENRLVNETTGLNVGAQLQASWLMRRGMAMGLEVDIDLALLAIEATLAYRDPVTLYGVYYGPPLFGPAGSFPAQAFGTTSKNNRFHTKIATMYRQIDAIYNLRYSQWYTGARATRVDTIIAQMAEVATYFASTYDPDGIDPYGRVVWKFFESGGFANQLLSVALFFQYIGLLADDDTFTDLAETLMRRIIDEHVEDGVWIEGAARGGFDGNYQMVSLDRVWRYVAMLPDGAWRNTVFGELVLGVNRWLRTVNVANGWIDDDGWSRTSMTGAEPGLFAVDFDRDVIALRLYELAYFLPEACQQVDLQTLALNVLIQGQSFEHQFDELLPEDNFDYSQGGTPGLSLTDILGAQLVGFIDFEDNTSITLDGSGNVESIVDTVSGGVYTQADAARRPSLIIGDMGRQVARFDGVDDRLVATPVPAGYPVGSDPGGFFGVVNQRSIIADTATKSVFSYGNSNSPTRRDLRRDVVSEIRPKPSCAQILVSSIYATRYAADFFGFCRVHAFTSEVVGGEAEIFAECNGFRGNSESVLPATQSTRAVIGSNTSDAQHWFGDVSCEIVYTGVLSDQQVADLYEWARTRAEV